MDRIDAEGVAEWIRDEKVTTWNGPPALLHSLAAMDSIRASDLASLREVWTGGGDCPEAIRAAFEAKFGNPVLRSEEHTSELQSLMRISYAVFCLKKKIQNTKQTKHTLATSPAYNTTPI